MDVTQEILRNHITYGSSDSTKKGYYSASRSLNYASGSTIQRAERQEVTILPFTLNYKDVVGLFGAENHFIKVQMNLDGTSVGCYEEAGWSCAVISEEKVGTEEYTRADQLAVVDFEKDVPEDMGDSYLAANLLPDTIKQNRGVRVKIDLNNLKTGNKYIDSWLDIRLYNRERMEHPYDIMYVSPKEFFYIGFHARNTKRLPYNVECLIGLSGEGLRGLEEKDAVDPRLLATN
jgi:hypothetical protein